MSVERILAPLSLGRCDETRLKIMIGPPSKTTSLELPRRTDPEVFEDGNASRGPRWRVFQRQAETANG
jgi:hypothetical protein